MPYNIWIFPLLGGYYIVSNYLYFKYKFQRLSAQRLIFHSIIIGIFSFIGIYFLRLFSDFLFTGAVQFIYDLVYSQTKIPNQPFLITSIVGFIVVIICVKLINYVYEKCNYFNRKKPVEIAVDKYGDELEQIFKLSFVKKLLIQITLKNEKVYVGYASEILPPQQTNFLKIIPIISGYRELETKIIHFNTEYYDAIMLYESNPEKFADITMDLIIKQDEILIANIFDIDIYEKFNPSTSD